MDALALRFWQKVNKTEECWLWTGAIYQGYGYLRNDGGTRLAHRISWLLFGKQLPEEGKVLDHICFEKSCVNPEHLRVLTREDNAARHKRGCGCGGCSPDKYKTIFCPKGHNKDSTGRDSSGACTLCRREWDRAYKRKLRSAVK